MQFVFTLLLAALLLPAPAFVQDQEACNAHFQSTWIRQVQPAFHSPYEGPHSLRGAPGASYSLTATASPGARLFVRRTFEFGGDDVAIDSDANQLKSTYRSQRIVVTAGNVSALDLFDASTYAHDPRTQFMNRALMTYGAYDYPADARGYTNGLAVDYDDGPWTLRAGRFAEPLKPNGLPLDNDLLRHYGDQVELVHTHTFGDLAGAVRVLAFRSRTRSSTFEDANAAAPAGDAPSLDAVRTRDHVKAGIGVDAEQQLASDLGVFVRAMKADGKTETCAFTESDASVTAGMSLKGTRWSRDKDVVGLAVGEDAISTAHRDYLQRGGLTSFLGDGTLRYGHERLAEIYYSAELGGGFTLTTDAQRVANPGYNKDRGPASFYALRLHWEV